MSHTRVYEVMCDLLPVALETCSSAPILIESDGDTVNWRVDPVARWPQQHTDAVGNSVLVIAPPGLNGWLRERAAPPIEIAMSTGTS